MSVTLLLSGGLGNQMFQYAAARALAARLKTKFIIDKRFYFNVTDNTKKYQLDNFNISAEEVSYDGDFLSPHGIIRRSLRLINREQQRQYIEKSFGYNEEFFDCHRNSILVGNFQSYKYFINIIDFILIEFCLKPELQQKYKNLSNSDNCVSIHVRRGDYLMYDGFSLNNMIDYYANSIAYLRQIYTNIQLRVFSDDIEWCLQQKIFADAEFVVTKQNEPPIFDLLRMSNCKAIVMANSSYSWWAAFFAEVRGATVCCPAQWFVDVSTSQAHIAPPSWQLIDWDRTKK
jgi:hypothetical protein